MDQSKGRNRIIFPNEEKKVLFKLVVQQPEYPHVYSRGLFWDKIHTLFHQKIKSSQNWSSNQLRNCWTNRSRLLKKKKSTNDLISDNLQSKKNIQNEPLMILFDSTDDTKKSDENRPTYSSKFTQSSKENISINCNRDQENSNSVDENISCQPEVQVEGNFSPPICDEGNSNKLETVVPFKKRKFDLNQLTIDDNPLNRLAEAAEMLSANSTSNDISHVPQMEKSTIDSACDATSYVSIDYCDNENYFQGTDEVNAIKMQISQLKETLEGPNNLDSLEKKVKVLEEKVDNLKQTQASILYRLQNLEAKQNYSQ